MSIEAYLKQAANAKVTNFADNIRDGRYTFLIKKIIAKVDGFKGSFFIVELRVLAAQAVDVRGTMSVPNAVGSDVSVAINMAKQTGHGDIRKFVDTLNGESTGEAEFVENTKKLLGDDQPACGMLIGDNTWNRPIKSGPNQGQPFTGHNWVHIPSANGNSAAEIAARRAELEKPVTPAAPAA